MFDLVDSVSQLAPTIDTEISGSIVLNSTDHIYTELQSDDGAASAWVWLGGLDVTSR